MSDHLKSRLLFVRCCLPSCFFVSPYVSAALFMYYVCRVTPLPLLPRGGEGATGFAETSFVFHRWRKPDKRLTCHQASVQSWSILASLSLSLSLDNTEISSRLHYQTSAKKKNENRDDGKTKTPTNTSPWKSWPPKSSPWTIVKVSISWCHIIA